MNADRRHIAQVCIELLKECNEAGLIRDESHSALVQAVTHLQKQEFWQQKNQAKWEGTNPATDKQLAISRVALPALESAVEALEEDDYILVIDQLTLAISTDGTPPKRKARRD